MISTIRFYDDLIPAIVSGDKTITIRRQSGRPYQPGEQFDVLRDSDGQCVAMIEIRSVETVLFQDLDESHARREDMTLADLKKLMAEIYPGVEHLSVISFKLLE